MEKQGWENAGRVVSEIRLFHQQLHNDLNKPGGSSELPPGGVFIAFFPVLGYTGSESKLGKKAGEAMATVALLDLWEKKSYKLKEVFKAYKRGLITHGELDYIVMQNGCLPVNQDQIPWSHVQHLVITNPSSRLAKNEQYPADSVHAHLVYFDQEERLLYIAWPRPDEIANLILQRSHALKSLRLYNLNVQSIPSLFPLRQLTSLDISKCNDLIELDGLANLKQLTYLNISLCQNLSRIDCLASLKHLRYLNLSGCKSITELHGLESLTQLTTLKLSNCINLTILPDGIRYMESLRMLDLMSMHLKCLPDWLPEIAERFTLGYNWSDGEQKAIVSLQNTHVEGVDMSIFEQPYEMVVKWFKDRNKVPLNEIKVVFLGDGEAGKSHTIARLMNDGGEPKGYVNVRTPGIVIKDLHYPVGERDTTLHLWDFGGQDILHSMHRIFLTERTFYVVLVDGSIGNQDERARYWLENIQSFAKDAPVLLVLNKLDDGLQADVNAVDLHDKFKGLKRIVKLSALQYSQERFNQVFRDALLEEIEKTKYLDAQWPASWIRVKQALEQMNAHYIRGSDYLRICREAHVDEGQKPLLHWFHDLGISFCHFDTENEALEDYVVLKPNWITNALYIILFNEREGSNGGLVPIHTIRQMLGWDAPNRDAIKRVIPDAYYVGYDVNYVLDVFHAFKLSFESDAHNEFFPMLADINAKPVAREYASTVNCLEFNMTFDYLPNNLLHRLMVERSAELDMENVWRTGARFQLTELGYSAVVVIDGNTLRFFIRHTDSMHRPNTYLTMLKAHVDRIVAQMGLKAPTCQLIYKLDDGRHAEFSYDRLLKMHKRGRREEYCEKLDTDFLIEDILNQSAPDNLDDEKKLLDRIIQACGNIQDEPIYRLVPKSDGQGYVNGKGMEDLRNRRVRDNLINIGYRMSDQSQRGSSGTGKSIGELDMLVYNDSNEPWTIIEALRVSDKDKSEWNKHLKKLSDNYNTRGFPALYLLTYVDADTTAFAQIWESYQDHIKTYDPGQLKYSDGSFVELDATKNQYIKVARCRYSGGIDPITVYHIFARIPTQNG